MLIHTFIRSLTFFVKSSRKSKIFFIFKAMRKPTLCATVNSVLLTFICLHCFTENYVQISTIIVCACNWQLRFVTFDSLKNLNMYIYQYGIFFLLEISLRQKCPVLQLVLMQMGLQNVHKGEAYLKFLCSTVLQKHETAPVCSSYTFTLGSGGQIILFVFFSGLALGWRLPLWPLGPTYYLILKSISRRHGLKFWRPTKMFPTCDPLHKMWYDTTTVSFICGWHHNSHI